MEKLSQDELWAIYDTLPNVLKDAIFSEDTAEAISNNCKLHDVEKTSEVAKIVGRILMGLLPPELFQETLQDEVGLEQDIAKKLAIEIEHFVFNPVKNELDALYNEDRPPEQKVEKKEAEPPKKADTYREPAE